MCVLSGFAQNQYIQVSWERPETLAPITGYVVYLFPSASDTTNAVDSIQVNSLTTLASFSDLSLDQIYYFRIIAYNSTSRSPYSDVVLGRLLNAQSVSSDVSASFSSATITWSTLDPSGSVLSGNTRIGQIKYHTDSLSLLQGSAGTYSVKDSNNTLNFSIDLTGLQANTTYYYFLTENDIDGNLVSTDILSFTTEEQLVDPDNNEPNNDFANATNWEIPGNITGYIFPGTDPDYFRCTIPEYAGTFTITLTPPANQGLNLRLDAYDHNFNLIQSSDATGNNGTETMELTSPTPGNYYFLVRDVNESGSGTAPYTLQGEITLADPDPNEDNNTFATATNLNIPGSIEGYIYPANDPDYFVISVPDSVDTLTVLGTPPTNGNLDLVIDLYNSQQSLVQSSNQTGTNMQEVLSVLSPQQGTYYIRISDNQSNYYINDPYTLQVRVHFLEDTTQIVNPDIYEKNDDFKSATIINPDNQYTAYIYPQNDPDFYILSGFDENKIALTMDTLPFPVTVTIYNSMEQEIRNHQFSVVDSIQVNVSSGGFIKIESSNSADYSHLFGYTFHFTTIEDSTPPVPPGKDIDYFAGPNPLIVGKSTEQGFHFQNLDSGFKISIYSLSMEKVWDYTVTTADGQEIIWTIKNIKGDIVSSGVYLAVVQDNTGKIVQKTKLVIIK